MNRREMLIGLLGGASIAALAALNPLQALHPTQLPALAPGNRWDGTPGSGFRTRPADPARVTAKPMIRMLVPPNQAFTDRQTIGVRAMANNQGSLYNNEGLEKVRLHYEGATLDIPEPSIREFRDANGNTVRYLGWWADLRHSGVNGEGHVYIEAIPRERSMQRRVIGPYSFLPSAREHDYELEVAATPAAIAGRRYRTLADALNYLHAQGDAQNPKITITEGGEIDPGAIFYAHDIAGWCTVEASVPVTFVKPEFTYDRTGVFRPKFGNFHFRGANITFNFANAISFYTEAGHRLWLDGVNIINSAGRNRFYRKGPPNANALFREHPYFTEAQISDVKNPCANAALVRGCKLARVVNDPFQDAAAVIGTFIDGCDVAPLAIDRPAMTARYHGRARSATLEATNPSDSASRTFTARVNGVIAGTFTVYNSQAAATAGTNYTVRNVADWLNDLPGWSASVLDNSYRATALSVPGNRGAAFGPTNMKRAAVTLQTHFDLHADLFGQNIGGLGENIIIADNVGINLDAQDVFYAARSPGLKDAAFVNNAFENRGNPVLASQFGGAGHSHIVVAHNSWAGQHLLLRGDLGWRGGRYSLIAGNVAKRIQWVGPVDPDTRIMGNQTYGGQRSPDSSVGTAPDNSGAGLFTAAQAGNFSPSSTLRSRQIPPVVRFDASGKLRRAGAPPGAYN